jgi:hypothetical protein
MSILLMKQPLEFKARGLAGTNDVEETSDSRQIDRWALWIKLL